MSENGNREEWLDALLARHKVQAPDSALTGRILADGLRLRQRRARIGRWLTGAGLIGIGLAGALSGATVVMVLSPSVQGLAPSETLETAFGSVQTEAQLAEIGEVQ
ncbi:hypothetical protein [Rhizobium sp. SL86]|uniref:hypothetical protein n=1 Tax=Rhizobium sp. SL86 TaxID=2995148 RepID=UPI0022753D10|nr:hypothetical protein [Rhizobium sp. SL86]MCY1664334.1 hypothetical protein [Rhizobium sp. SL86]